MFPSRLLFLHFRVKIANILLLRKYLEILQNQTIKVSGILSPTGTLSKEKIIDALVAMTKQDGSYFKLERTLGGIQLNDLRACS